MKTLNVVTQRYIVRDSEAGNIIEYFDTIKEAKNSIIQFEIEDGESVGFYEIYDSENSLIIS